MWWFIYQNPATMKNPATLWHYSLHQNPAQVNKHPADLALMNAGSGLSRGLKKSVECKDWMYIYSYAVTTLYRASPATLILSSVPEYNQGLKSGIDSGSDTLNTTVTVLLPRLPCWHQGYRAVTMVTILIAQLLYCYHDFRGMIIVTMLIIRLPCR